MKNNKKGFTIVELVIVIAVIAILAAVLIPTFVSVTAKARANAALQAASAAHKLVSAEVAEQGGVKNDSYYAYTSKLGKEADYAFAIKEGEITAVDIKKDFLFGDTELQNDDVIVLFVSEDAYVTGTDNKGAAIKEIISTVLDNKTGVEGVVAMGTTIKDGQNEDADLYEYSYTEENAKKTNYKLSQYIAGTYTFNDEGEKVVKLQIYTAEDLNAAVVAFLAD